MLKSKALDIEVEGIAYSDIWLRLMMVLLGTHFIVSQAEPEHILGLLQLKAYYVAMLYNLPIGLLLVYLVFYLNKYMDAKWPWISFYGKRISAQILLGICLPALVTFLMVSLYFAILGVNILNTSYFVLDYVLVLILITFLNLYYVAQYFIRFTFKMIKAGEELLLAKNNDPVSKKEEKTKNYIGQDQDESSVIACYYYENRYNFSYSMGGERASVNGTISEIYKTLDRNWYFKVREGFIVHRDFIIGECMSTSRRRRLLLQACYTSIWVKDAAGVMVKKGVDEVFVPQRSYMAFYEWFKD